MHRHTAQGHWAVELLQCTATVPVGSGQQNCCNAPPHCPRAVGSGAATMHRHTARGQWAVELPQCGTATLPVGTSYNALPHCLGAVGREPL